MTNEEAKRYILENWFDGDQDVKAVVGGDKETMAMKMAVEALEKQIPKKPIRANRAIEIDGQLFMNDDNEFWKCPMCTLYDVPLRENQRYCHYCGQAIDWSDTE